MIRTARLEDCQAISSVFAKAWKVAYRGIFSQSYLDKIKEDHWTQGFQKGIGAGKNLYLVYETEEGIVGALAAGKNRWDLGEAHEIYALYVLPDYQGQGVGRALTQAALATLGKSVYVLAVDRNHQARSFYEKCGFLDTGQKIESQLNGAPFTNVVFKIEQ